MTDFGKWEDRSGTGSSLRTIRLRTNSDRPTIEFKTKRVIELLKTNEELQITVKMRGREIARPEHAHETLKLLLSNVIPLHGRMLSEPTTKGSLVTCRIAAARTDSNNNGG